MTWIVVEDPKFRYPHLAFTSEVGVPGLLWADTYWTVKQAIDLLTHTALVHNFCEDFTEEELTEMKSLKNVRLIHQAQMESLSGIFQEVVEDCQTQVQLLVQIYIHLCDAIALGDLSSIHKAALKIEDYTTEKGINLDA